MPKNLSDARTTVSLRVLINAIENLLVEMDTHYYVAQTHQARLKKLLGRLYALREKQFGSEAASPLTGSDLLSTLNLDDYKDLLEK